MLSRYSNYPQGRYVSLAVVRRVESEAIFRTEGSGEPLNKEFVHAGLADESPVIQRVVISKRKQVAVERRTGRELLRYHDLLFARDDDVERYGICALNRNNPCERCVDCMIYGYAVGGGGAQKSRVMTDDAFSILPAPLVTDKRQFNALFDTGTMRDPETRRPSTSIGTDEYVKPETHFLDIETLKDVTGDELTCILGNVLRSTRYGAISSRIGKVRNTVVGIAFSDCELFSNLELTQRAYDILKADSPDLGHPLRDADVIAAARQALADLRPQVVGQVTLLQPQEVEAVVQDTRELFADKEQVKELLTRLTAMYQA
jgi:CRISPR-associated protein Csc2